MTLTQVIAISFMALVKLAIIVWISPLLIFPSVALILVGIWFGTVYQRAVLPVKREMNNSRSPVLAHFGAAIAGLGKFSSLMVHLCSKVVFSVN